MQRMDFDNETQLAEDDVTRKEIKHRALSRFKTAVNQGNGQYSPKDLKAMDMLNLKRNFLIVSNQALSSERARNFQIELSIPPIE